MVKKAATKIAGRFVGHRMRKLYKEQGILFTNLYLEGNQSQYKPSYQTKVSVIGEFSRPQMWQVDIACSFDSFFKCYKSDVIPVKIGDLFKFMIESQAQYDYIFPQVQYVTSSRYGVVKDHHKQANNCYNPKRIHRVGGSNKVMNKMRESVTTHNETNELSGYSDDFSNKNNRSLGSTKYL